MIIADAHVHLHDCFDLGQFFVSAWTNFSTVSSSSGNSKNFCGVLFLTESLGVNWFSRFKEAANGSHKDEKIPENLGFHSTGEENSLKVQLENGEELILIAGRQIVSAENLEVLALGIPEHSGEGRAIGEIMQEIHSRGGISIIPWGMGKWMGKRAKIIDGLISNDNQVQFFLGDNGNRASFLPLSRFFTEAREKGIANVPGSDPLPFQSEAAKPGSFGFTIDGTLNRDQPFEDIKTKLRDSSADIRTYGKLESPLRFLRNQIAMQLKKHIRN